MYFFPERSTIRGQIAAGYGNTQQLVLQACCLTEPVKQMNENPNTLDTILRIRNQMQCLLPNLREAINWPSDPLQDGCKRCFAWLPWAGNWNECTNSSWNTLDWRNIGPNVGYCGGMTGNHQPDVKRGTQCRSVGWVKKFRERGYILPLRPDAWS